MTDLWAIWVVRFPLKDMEVGVLVLIAIPLLDEFV